MLWRAGVSASKAMYVEPQRKIRPDVPVKIIEGAGHIVCIFKPDFKAAVKGWLERDAAK